MFLVFVDLFKEACCFRKKHKKSVIFKDLNMSDDDGFIMEL